MLHTDQDTGHRTAPIFRQRGRPTKTMTVKTRHSNSQKLLKSHRGGSKPRRSWRIDRQFQSAKDLDHRSAFHYVFVRIVKCSFTFHMPLVFIFCLCSRYSNKVPDVTRTGAVFTALAKNRFLREDEWCWTSETPPFNSTYFTQRFKLRKSLLLQRFRLSWSSTTVQMTAQIVYFVILSPSQTSTQLLRRPCKIFSILQFSCWCEGLRLRLLVGTWRLISPFSLNVNKNYFGNHCPLPATTFLWRSLVGLGLEPSATNTHYYYTFSQNVSLTGLWIRPYKERPVTDIKPCPPTGEKKVD
jgi:hypothetical protein